MKWMELVEGGFDLVHPLLGTIATLRGGDKWTLTIGFKEWTRDGGNAETRKTWATLIARQYFAKVNNDLEKQEDFGI